MASSPDLDIDLTEFDAAIPRSGQPLKLDTVLAGLDSDRADKLRAALARPDLYTANAIARVLRAWGCDVSTGAVRNWRARRLDG